MSVTERLQKHLACTPALEGAAFIAANSTINGDVVLGPDASVFYGAVLRGDINIIRVGKGSNIQDNAIVHLSDAYGTVGHAVTLHGCTVEDGCLVGMGSIILDGARIGAGSIVGAGSLVTMGFECPADSMVMGRPAKVVRPLKPEELGTGRRLAEKYVEVAKAHAALQAKTKPDF
jgi:carbonic anhydrase/acetyltransferase-like protein (isoleucine patch superfamily)